MGVNHDLPPLPSDDEVVAAVAKIVADKTARYESARARGLAYAPTLAATATDVAYELDILPAHRLGNGAVKGSWSGRMAPALRIAPRLRALQKQGRLRPGVGNDHDRYKRVYVVA